MARVKINVTYMKFQLVFYLSGGLPLVIFPLIWDQSSFISFDLSFPNIIIKFNKSKSFCHFARYLPDDLPDAVFGLYFKNGAIIFSETWYVTISDSTASPLQG